MPSHKRYLEYLHFVATMSTHLEKQQKKKGIEIEAIYENSFRINQIVINDDDDLYEARNYIIVVSVYALVLYYLFSI